MRSPRILALTLALLVSGGAATAIARPSGVVVNREPLGVKQVRDLSRAVGQPIRPGRYWYDRVSGAWGVEGGPMQGVLPAGMPIGGKMWRGASGGHTGVIVNGRELHAVDVARLRRAGVPVQRGRFWLNARGIGGREGGPPAFDLSRALGLRGGGAKRSKGSILSGYDKTGLKVY